LIINEQFHIKLIDFGIIFNLSIEKFNRFWLFRFSYIYYSTGYVYK
jgi:hypothetical protein